MTKEEVYNDLRHKIVKEEIVPGRWLVEREISEQYGISRTPVREILRRLVSDGFIELNEGKGYSVTKLSIDRIVKIFQAREAVEGMAAYLTCQKGNEDFFRLLKTLKEELNRIDILSDTLPGIEIGRKLHDAILQASDNPFLIEFYNKLKNLASLTRNITRKSVSIEQESKRAHLNIIDAIETKDSKKSQELVGLHLRATCRRLLKDFYNEIIE